MSSAMPVEARKKPKRTATVQRVFRCVMEPRMEWAFKRDAAELARERERREKRETREKVSA
ncbi:hypothetical protein SGRIM128S_06930 [Streptomyces griseomycini]